MKWLVLIVLLLGSIGCAANSRSNSTPVTVPIENTAVSSPNRSVELAPTDTVAVPATRVVIVTLVAPQPTSTSISPPRPTLTATLPDCPPLPAPTAEKTQAAVQHYEHGVMMWLPTRAEIWTLIAAPIPHQFYWRVLPDTWSDTQPESDPSVLPPADRFQPVRGFGVAWRTGGGSYGPQRADLGWAIDQEQGFATFLIYFPQGFYAPDCTWQPKSGIYELRDAQDVVYQFVGAGGIAKIVTSGE
jgi:hypothetical protein